MKMKKPELKMKLVSAAFIVLMLCSTFVGAVSADMNDTNENKSLNIIDKKVISIIKSIFSGAESDASTTQANVSDAKVKFIRSFSDEQEFEKYIGKPKEEQVIISSKSPRKIMSEKEIKFYDSKILLFELIKGEEGVAKE